MRGFGNPLDIMEKSLYRMILISAAISREIMLQLKKEKISNTHRSGKVAFVS